ncbi:MAG: GNAT family N-acetyltransferase [bacterium]|nr:GNAT family N-acetyltransferase [bacterium]
MSSSFTFRKFATQDGGALYEALKDPKVVRHMATSGLSLKDCEGIIQDSLIHWREHDIGSYAVLNEGSEDIVGWAGFKLWKEGEYEILMVLSPGSWGLGFKIYEDLIHRAKQDFHLQKIFVLLPETRRSFRLVEKLGFQFCGVETFNQEPFRKFQRLL